MSGHSKWSQIKRQKAVTDKKKGGLFTKLANAITVAARNGGGDPAMNFKLRITVEKARAANMPNDNIDRAITKGIGGGDGATLEEVVYEGFGPSGVAIIAEVTTDNKNRSASEIRNIFSKCGGNLGNTGSVGYLFSKKGVLRILKNKVINKDDFELRIIDAGAEDIIEEDEGFTIYTPTESLAPVKDAVEKMGLVPETADIELIPATKVAIADQQIKDKITNLLDELDANDGVTNYYTNADL